MSRALSLLNVCLGIFALNVLCEKFDTQYIWRLRLDKSLRFIPTTFRTCCSLILFLTGRLTFDFAYHKIQIRMPTLFEKDKTKENSQIFLNCNILSNLNKGNIKILTFYFPTKITTGYIYIKLARSSPQLK